MFFFCLVWLLLEVGGEDAHRFRVSRAATFRDRIQQVLLLTLEVVVVGLVLSSSNVQQVLLQRLVVEVFVVGYCLASKTRRALRQILPEVGQRCRMQECQWR